MTASPDADPCARDRRPRPDPGWWFAALWLVFLVMPAAALLDSGASLPERLLGWAGVLLFAAAYALSFRSPQLLPVPREPANTVGWAVVLVALAALTVPALGTWVFAMAPYVGALLAFRLPLRTGLVALAALLAAVVAAVLGGALPDDGAWVLTVQLLMSTVIIGGMRLLVHTDEQHLALASELALVQEREAVARDVHDILGHTLTVITVKAELAQRLLDREPERARAELDDVLRLSRGSLAEVRATVGRLRTPDFAAQVEACRTALAAAGIEADVAGRADAVTGPRRAVFAWALREAVTNVVRHSAASRCTVRWTPTALTVTDDGDGLMGPEGNGLRGLRERVTHAGGALAVGEAGPDGGTVLEVRLP